jgi:Bardet-Biedl syndrome 7 protein
MHAYELYAPQESENSIELFYKNVFTQTLLICNYTRGEIRLESDSVTTLAIAKDVISREATARRVQLEDRLSVNPSCVTSCIDLIRPRIEHQLSLERKVRLSEAIKEIVLGETSTPWLSAEYAQVLLTSESCAEEMKLRPKVLQCLIGILTDLVVDFHKLKGSDIRHKLPELQQTLLDGRFDDLPRFLTRAGK